MKIHVFYQVIVFAITLFIMAEQEPDVSTCIDWSKCVLCQEATTEALQSPNNSTRSDIDPGAGYHTLANNILRFNEINSLPDTIDITKLDDGNGIASTLMKWSAQWHKTCYNKFNTLRFQRAVKEKAMTNPAAPCPLSLHETTQVPDHPTLKAPAFFVTILQVLFIEPPHLTWMQTFVNVPFNLEIKYFLQN